MTLICTCTVPLSWLLSRLDDVEISDDILKDQTLASVFKILYFSFVVWSSPGGRCQRQLLTNVKALENTIPGLFDRWKFIPVEFFCKGSSIDCLLSRSSTGTSACWSPSAGEKLFFPLLSGILAGCMRHGNTCLGRFPSPHWHLAWFISLSSGILPHSREGTGMS